MKPGKFEKLGLRSRFDFVLHLPLRYEDETVLTAVSAAPPGRPVLVEARVRVAFVSGGRARRCSSSQSWSAVHRVPLAGATSD